MSLGAYGAPGSFRCKLRAVDENGGLHGTFDAPTGYAKLGVLLLMI